MTRSAPRAIGFFLMFLTACAALVVATPLAAHAEGSGVDVTVLVRDEAGTGVPNIPITVEGDGYTTSTNKTDTTGNVKLSLPKGTYTVTADASALPGPVKTFATNPQQLAIKISVATSVRFEVGAPTGGAAAPGTSTSASASASDSSDTTSTSAGPSAFDTFMGKTITGVIFGLILALASIGVSLIYGTTGLNNFAQGEMTTLGGFASFWFISTFGLSQALGDTGGAWVGLLFAAGIGAAFGWFQDAVIWKPLRRRRVGIIQAMVVSIGLAILLRYIFAFQFGSARLLPTQNLDAMITLWGVNLTYWSVWGSVICIVLLLATAYVLNYTRIGKATRAVADNKALAAASGIDVDRAIRVVWVGSGFLAAVAGVLLSYYQTIYFMSGAQILLMVFAAVTLGGLGTALGGLIGSLVISIMIELSTYIIPTDLKLVTALVLMIIILLVRPQGILGKRQRVG